MPKRQRKRPTTHHTPDTFKVSIPDRYRLALVASGHLGIASDPDPKATRAVAAALLDLADPAPPGLNT